MLSESVTHLLYRVGRNPWHSLRAIRQCLELQCKWQSYKRPKWSVVFAKRRAEG